MLCILHKLQGSLFYIFARLHQIYRLLLVRRYFLQIPCKYSSVCNQHRSLQILPLCLIPHLPFSLSPINKDTWFLDEGTTHKLRSLPYVAKHSDSFLQLPQPAFPHPPSVSHSSDISYLNRDTL